jgi:hypothetical protein
MNAGRVMRKETITADNVMAPFMSRFLLFRLYSKDLQQYGDYDLKLGDILEYRYLIGDP